MYRERMNSYYPQVIQSILEFQAIIDAEYPEFEEIESSNKKVMSDAYLLTMTEDRIAEWEKMLGIRPLEDSSVEDRRETIIARIRGQGKLNTEMINIIVNTFTGGTANSWVKDSTLYVEITPPPNNKQYRFENVEQELSKKVPAHLNFEVSRNYYTWEETKNEFTTWGKVRSSFGKWEDVLLFVPFEIQTKTISGVVLSIKDADDSRLQGLTIYGKTKQNGTPTPETPVELVSVGASGAINTMVCGKNLYSGGDVVVPKAWQGYQVINFHVDAEFPKFTLSFNPNGFVGRLECLVQDAKNLVLSGTESRVSLVITPQRSHFSNNLLYNNTGEEKSINFTDIQIELGNTATDYEPYKEQTLTASTPNGLLGIPLGATIPDVIKNSPVHMAGVWWNEEVQQYYMSDTIDFARGVYVQRVLPMSIADSVAIILHEEKESSTRFKFDVGVEHIGGMGFCSHLQRTDWGDTPNTIGFGPITSRNRTTAYMEISGKYTVNTIKELMGNNNWVCMVALETPIEKPLSADEVEQYRTLVTHKNYTTVYNDQNAWIDVTYAQPSKRS